MSEAFIDAVVIGAGPAGSLAARGLAQRGHEVWLIDKQSFPRPKVCGCCLNRYALTTLDRVGLEGLVQDLGARPLQRLEMIAAGRRAHVPLPRGVSLSRAALDGALIESAQAAGNVTFIDGTSAKVQSLGETAEQGHRVVLGNGQTVRARVVIVADGLGGSSLSAVPGYEVKTAAGSRLGLGGLTSSPIAQNDLADGTIAMACGDDGYLGVVELEDGRLDFAAAIDAGAVKAAGGLEAATYRLVEQAGLDAEDWALHEVERWRATPALTRTRQRLAGPGLFVVGDAAGYVEPFTGEGMAWAIAGGAAVADVASAAIREWEPVQEIAWNTQHQQRVRQRQAGCKWVAATLRRPRLTRAVVRTLAAFPVLARPLVGKITAPASATPATIHRPSAQGTFA
ncbi:MAG: NAD(P)/FAD-dependent oxidoreductase [Planctomycetota bacterium]